MNLALLNVAASVSEWTSVLSALSSQLSAAALPSALPLAAATPAAASDAFLERAPGLLRDLILSPLPASLHWFVGSLLAIVTVFVVFATLFAFLTLAERKILGRIQNRPGPNRAKLPWIGIRTYGLAQPFADGIKMLTKEDIVPRAADQVLHFLAPVALLAFSILTFAVIPFGRHLVPVELDAAVLYFFAAGAATELAVFMAGWASRNKYSLLAAMRALAQLISYELPLLLSIIPVVLIAGTMSTTAIVEKQGGWLFGFLPHWHVFTPWGFAAFAIFMVSALAESNRSPFDLPEAESELIAGHLTEYSGFKYAIFFMAEYFGMCALSGMGVTLFLGGWQAPLPGLEFIPSYAWFAAKLLALLFGFIWIRATFPRLRMDQLTRLAWKFLVPLALLNLGNAAFWSLTAGWTGPLQLARWALSAAIVVGPFVLLGRGLTRGVAPRTYRYAT
jgi:NADH-quinone oxidoreductase subunit H